MKKIIIREVDGCYNCPLKVSMVCSEIDQYKWMAWANHDEEAQHNDIFHPDCPLPNVDPNPEETK